MKFDSFLVEEDRKLNVILRGLDRNFELEKIEEKLRLMGFEPEEMSWFKTGPGRKKPTNLIRFIVPKDQEKILKIQNLLNIRVRVERLRTHTYENVRQIGRRHRSQEYGHVMSNYNAKPHCHKCKGDYFYLNCQKIEQRRRSAISVAIFWRAFGAAQKIGI